VVSKKAHRYETRRDETTERDESRRGLPVVGGRAAQGRRGGLAQVRIGKGMRLMTTRLGEGDVHGRCQRRFADGDEERRPGYGVDRRAFVGPVLVCGLCLGKGGREL
jgi:hypothetical protein